MFDRFTPEARRSLELASEVATSRGDAAVAPDHLLAALADPASGLAATLLADAGVGRFAVEAAMGPSGRGAGARTPPFTAATKKALELALRESLNLAHGHIGSGHLLLGLLRLGEGMPATLLAEHGLTLEGARVAVGERSEGARLGGRRRPRRTGRVVEAPTPHEQAKAAAAAPPPPPAEDDVLRLASEEGSRLHKALAALGVTPHELQAALAEVAAEPDDGPVELHLGPGATLRIDAGARAADLRALLGAHVDGGDDADGTLRVEVPALGDAVWATIEGWLSA